MSESSLEKEGSFLEARSRKPKWRNRPGHEQYRSKRRSDFLPEEIIKKLQQQAEKLAQEICPRPRNKK